MDSFAVKILLKHGKCIDDMLIISDNHQLAYYRVSNPDQDILLMPVDITWMSINVFTTRSDYLGKYYCDICNKKHGPMYKYEAFWDKYPYLTCDRCYLIIKELLFDNIKYALMTTQHLLERNLLIVDCRDYIINFLNQLTL